MHATGPVATSALGTDSGSTELGNTIVAPSLTAATGTLYLAVWSAKNMSMSIEPAPGTTEHTDSSAVSTLATASQAGAGPATGTRTATLANGASSERRIGQALVLNPA